MNLMQLPDENYKMKKSWKAVTRINLRVPTSFLFFNFYSHFQIPILIFISEISAWRLVFWNSIHMEVASDSFCFLVYSSWLLVFILYVFELFFSFPLTFLSLISFHFINLHFFLLQIPIQINTRDLMFTIQRIIL